MSGLFRSARPCVVALLALALVRGINGLVGAIHSDHHLPAPVETRAHAVHDWGHDGGHGQADPLPAGAPGEICPVAAAALHLAAAEVAARPALDPAPAEAELVAPGQPETPSLAWRQPGTGRAPPSLHSLAS
ncbi:MAG: hypothetical protein HYR50_12500 [Candidatus Rokubacteria bacterium]|nr:hypothetical protein [Candidatus Rokubacteria bacterium]